MGHSWKVAWVALAALVGCGGGGKAKPKYVWESISNDGGGFTVHYPVWSDEIGWHARNVENSTVVDKPGGGDIDCAAEVNALAGESLDDHVAADLKERKKNKGFNILSGPKKFKKGKGQRVTYEMKSHLWKTVGDGYHKEIVTYILKGKKVYTLRTSARRDKWDIRVEYFKDMHRKFKVH